MRDKTVESVMTPRLFFLKTEDSVARALDIFEETHISGAPVIDTEENYVGVLSKTDFMSRRLLKLLSEGKTLENIPVSELMSKRLPISVKEHDSLERAMEIMKEQNIHRLFVEDRTGQLSGVISSFDIVRLMVDDAKTY